MNVSSDALFRLQSFINLYFPPHFLTIPYEFQNFRSYLLNQIFRSSWDLYNEFIDDYYAEEQGAGTQLNRTQAEQEVIFFLFSIKSISHNHEQFPSSNISFHFMNE